jgi:hypothetical protein
MPLYPPEDVIPESLPLQVAAQGRVPPPIDARALIPFENHIGPGAIVNPEQHRSQE